MNSCGVNYFQDPYWRLKCCRSRSQANGIEFITGIGEPTCAIGGIGDVYIDLTNGNLYYKTEQPTAPVVRAIPLYTGVSHNVGSGEAAPYDDIQTAIDAANAGDRLLLVDSAYTITATINVNKPITIQGLGAGITTIEKTAAAGGTTMINITSSNVVLQDLTLVQDYPSTVTTEAVVSISGLTLNEIYIDSCEILPCEFGITTNAAEFQITNCSFGYAPLADLNNSYRCIAITANNGTSIIDSNTFSAESGNTRCYFTVVTNLSGPLLGQLVVSNNEQVASSYTLRHLLDIEEFVGNDFQLFIINNTTISEGNVPVLLANPDLSIFRFIDISGNSVQNTAGKGIVGIDFGYTGTTDIYDSNNTVANPNFSGSWASATDPESITVGYNTAAISTDPNLPLAACYWLPLI